MPMTGVMPLPAVRKRTFAGARAREGEVAGGLVEHHEGARRGGADQVVRDLAVGDRLGGDRDAARGDAGGGRAVGAVGQAVGPPVAHAVDVDADPDVLAGDVPEPAATGPDDDRHGIRGLGAHLEDAAAQVGARAQRVDQVEVVTGHERGGQGLGHLAGPTQHAPEGSGGVGSEPLARRRRRAHRVRPRGGRGRSVDGGGAHYPSVTYATVTYETVTTTFPPDPATFRFAPQRLRGEGERSGAEQVAMARVEPCPRPGRGSTMGGRCNRRRRPGLCMGETATARRMRRSPMTLGTRGRPTVSP